MSPIIRSLLDTISIAPGDRCKGVYGLELSSMSSKPIGTTSASAVAINCPSRLVLLPSAPISVIQNVLVRSSARRAPRQRRNASRCRTNFLPANEVIQRSHPARNGQRRIASKIVALSKHLAMRLLHRRGPWTYHLQTVSPEKSWSVGNNLVTLLATKFDAVQEWPRRSPACMSHLCSIT